jgi:6-pyruvoyltetrahydropterin/6-carboxytetrahydropterin synthase
MPSFRVHVTKDYTVFCAGHFITYEGDKCEPLHGHNYRVDASVAGELDENAYVFNFTTLKKILRAICNRLDHRMLLPLNNPRLRLSEEGPSVSVRYRERLYVFPREDVVLLPIPNTTAEMLAQWIGGEIESALREQGADNLTMLEVEVEESFGQSAFCRKELRAA